MPAPEPVPEPVPQAVPQPARLRSGRPSLLPPWPSPGPAHGGVRLRAFTEADVPMVVEMATDPYVPLIGSLTADASPEQAMSWIRRQQGRHREGAGFSFAIAAATPGRAPDPRSDPGSDSAGEGLGAIGLWLRDLDVGRATAGYSVAPSHRGRGVASDALIALATFAWTVPGLDRVELHVEPWNVASLTVARRAGFGHETLLRRYQEIGGRRRDMVRLEIRR